MDADQIEEKYENSNLLYGTVPSTHIKTKYKVADDLDESPRDQEKDEFVEYKFNENRYIEELHDYVDATYNQHYSREKFQAVEFIYDGGHGSGFNIGNVLKYAQRYGKKGSRDEARKDLMKVLHYTLLQLWVHDNDK